jgi:hypothetical protein
MNTLSEKIYTEQIKNNYKTAVFSTQKYTQKYTQNKNKYIEQIAKTTLAIANATGGNIFIGVLLKKGKVQNVEDIPSALLNLAYLKKILYEHISPEIPNINISKIPFMGKEIIRIQIPNSTEKPHMFSDYKYYKRVLSKNQILEEYEIRQMYQSLSKADLQILGMTNLQGIPNMSNNVFEKIKFYPRIHIANNGQAIEKDYKLELHIPSDIIDENFTILHKYLKGYKNNKNIYAITGTEPLFQKESKTLIELSLKLNTDNYELFKKEKIELILYTAQKTHRIEYTLVDTFHYKGKFPNIKEFVTTEKHLNS